MTSKRAALLALCSSLAAPLACSGTKQVDIGTTITGAELSDYAGTWDGYAEAFSFPHSTGPRPDRIHLILDASGQGTMEVGDATLYPHPTDPYAPYPPTADGFVVLESGVIAGIQYPVHDARVEQKRIRFDVDSSDTFREWCTLQTPERNEFQFQLSGISVYHCANPGCPPPEVRYDGGLTDYDGGTIAEPAGCMVARLCAFVCHCDSSACGPLEDESGVAAAMPVDAALNTAGSELQGTFVYDALNGVSRISRLAIRLTRQ